MHGSTKYNGVFGSIQTILKEDGARGLYKGNLANITRILPVYALKFMFNDSYKQAVLKPGQNPATLSFGQLLAVGWLAGVSQSCITYPLEVVRTRLTIDTQMGGTYRGIVHCGVQTVRDEGVRGLYKGMSMTFLSTPIYVGLQMTLYDVFKRNLPTDQQTGKSSLVWSFLAGASAGLIAQTTAYPGDTIKKQLQSNGVHGSAQQYTGLFDCCRKGIRGFYPGLALNSVKCVPEAGLQFVCYDIAKQLMGLP